MVATTFQRNQRKSRRRIGLKIKSKIAREKKSQRKQPLNKDSTSNWTRSNRLESRRFWMPNKGKRSVNTITNKR